MPSKADAPTVWTLDGILSSSTAPGTAFGAVSAAAVGVAAGVGAAAGARGVTRGGATGVVAITRISGRAVVLAAGFGFSCAAATLDAKSHAMGAAHNP